MSSAGIDERDNFLTFTNEDYGIQIQYPANWNYSPGIQKYLIVSFIPPSDTSKENLIDLLYEDIQNQDEVSAERKLGNYFGKKNASVALYSFPSFNKTLEAFVQDEISELEQGFPNFVMVSSRIHNLQNGFNGYEIIYTGTLSSAQQQKILTIWIEKNGKIYQITYLSNPEIYPLYLNTVNKMINSFSFI